jgi:hypothetical protein
MHLAENYLASQFRTLGLNSAANPDYRQPFTIYDWYYQNNSVSTTYGQAEVLQAFAGTVQDSVNLVFAGNGAERDYFGLPTKNNIVAYYFGGTDEIVQQQAKIADEAGAKYTLFIHQSEDTFGRIRATSHAALPRASLVDKGDKLRKGMLYNLTEEDFLKLYAPAQQQFITRYEAEGKLARKDRKQLVQPISLNFNFRTKPVNATNIIGVIEGSDLKNEVVVLSAHYDHLGTEGGEVFYGADDNASGSSALLEMARVFMLAKAEGHGPRRTLVFAHFSAEEEGLLGAEHYTGNPTYPLEQTVANLNFDMIGRVNESNSSQPNYVYVIGSGQRSDAIYQLNALSQQTYLPNLRLDYTYDGTESQEKLYKRSDQYHFHKNGVPILFYTDLMKADYHQATDTADKIALEQLRMRVQLGFATAWELANRD